MNAETMDYDYIPLHKEVDIHNRCCGGKFWCIKVKLLIIFIKIFQTKYL